MIVASFGNMFNDASLGNDPWHDPTPAERARYDVLFALLQHLVWGDQIVIPTRNAAPLEPKINVPLVRPLRGGTAPPRRGGM